MGLAATVIRWPVLGYRPMVTALVRPGPVHCPACDRRMFDWWPCANMVGAIRWQDTCKKCGIFADLMLVV